jgi:sortase A
MVTEKSPPLSSQPQPKPEQPSPQVPRLAHIPSSAVKDSLVKPIAPRSPEQHMRVSKAHWDKYHEAWQNYYKKHYASTVQKIPEHQAPTEEDLRRDIEEEAYKSPPGLWKTLFSRKVLPFTIGITAILVLGFLQYNRNIVGFFATFLAPNHGNIALAEIPDPTFSAPISPSPRLYIPKINVSVPVTFGVGPDHDSQMRAMENGVAQFPIPGANAMPGQVGNLALSGHSSNDLFDRGDYKFIFARLERLTAGDMIFLDYGGTRFAYRVTHYEEVLPHQSYHLVFPTDRPMLTLITCTPVGTALRRLLVFAEQISPIPDILDTPIIPDGGDDAPEFELPSNSPTFFERIRSFFTRR